MKQLLRLDRVISRLFRFRLLAALALVAVFSLKGLAEGTADFRNFDGLRLFYWANQSQQLKVYAEADEFINVGASHVGIGGGLIEVYRPDGTLHSTFDNTGPNAGQAIINNDVEELNGPTGTTNGGYQPGVVTVAAGEAGIWTVIIRFPTVNNAVLPFTNLQNGEPWNRTQHQPTRWAVTAWDITISQSAAGNDGGQLLDGRVYSNNYIAIINGNNNVTSPQFIVLTKDGNQYLVDFLEADPFGFNLFSNNVGIVNANGSPTYKSGTRQSTTVSGDPSTWVDPNQYLYEATRRDFEGISNNKIFFNIPAADLPANAPTTDIINNDPHDTWLLNNPVDFVPSSSVFGFVGFGDATTLCAENFAVSGFGGFFYFDFDAAGGIALNLDINNNGNYFDDVDVRLFKDINQGADSIFWDGKDGLGNFIPSNTSINLNYQLNHKNGEVHLLLEDIENNPGGVLFTRLNGPDAPQNSFFYDHSTVNGPVSGGGMVPTLVDQPFTYDANYGNDKILDYWAFVDNGVTSEGTLTIFFGEECNTDVAIDTDLDGISDPDDIDDDNDGITDSLEYCHGTGGFACLVLGVDPSGDADNDKVLNYRDANDPAFVNPCNDDNNDGLCDHLPAELDLDGDGVPDFYDLDSDNDGITDLYEAGHNQLDADGDGRIDGVPADFGANGFFNAIASDADALTALPTFTLWDWDNDGVPDHDDLDSDNDGINDVTEAGFAVSDTNNDGLIDDGTGNVPVVSPTGLAPEIDPAKTGTKVPFPLDTDTDGVGDWHDLDADNDGIHDVREGGNMDPDGDGEVGSSPLTVNAFGQTNGVTSQPTDTDGDELFDFQELDSDDDGLTDVSEARFPDDDFDGVIGTGMPAVDAKGVPTGFDTTSDPQDLDNDGIPDFQDIDRDGDGIPDYYECETGVPCPDTDDDGLVDADDLDTDGDGMPDELECASLDCPDSDMDGLPDWRDYECNVFTVIPEIGNTAIPGTQCEGIAAVFAADNGNADFTGNMNFEWRGPNGFVETGTLPASETVTLVFPQVNVSQAGSYQLTLFNDRGCPSEPVTFQLGVLPTPAPPTVTAEEGPYCSGENTFVTATSVTGNNPMYSWYLLNNGVETLVTTTTAPFLPINDLTDLNAGIYSVTGSTNGCESGRSNGTLVEVVPFDTDNLATNRTTSNGPACAGADVQLEVPRTIGAEYVWSGPLGFSSILHNPVLSEVTPEMAGVYSVETYIDGCLANASTTSVFYTDAPIAEFDQFFGEPSATTIIGNVLNNDSFAEAGFTLTVVNAPKFGTVILNEDGSLIYTQGTEFSGSDIMSYELCLTSCPDRCSTALVELLVGNTNDLFIPNVFTPNEDGTNDFFEIPGLDQYPDNEFTIFNRWGDEVFFGEGYRNDWDGRFKNERLPAGTYFYTLKTEPSALGQQGFFLLVR